MASPVVISRIQNRRGTQSQFDAMYPHGYTGVGGSSGPGILQPGEIALCTDSRRIFIGNLNGEYIEFGAGTGGGPDIDIFYNLDLTPVTIDLPPAATWTNIPSLTYNITPFYNLLYSITDATTLNWNDVGTTLSRNGEMRITAISTTSGGSTQFTANFTSDVQTGTFPLTVQFTDTSTFGTTTASVASTDAYTEININVGDIYLKARASATGDKIEIWYIHDFPTNLKFTTSSINWVPFGDVAPVVGFTSDVQTGIFPLIVQFQGTYY